MLGEFRLDRSALCDNDCPTCSSNHSLVIRPADTVDATGSHVASGGEGSRLQIIYTNVAVGISTQEGVTRLIDGQSLGARELGVSLGADIIRGNGIRSRPVCGHWSLPPASRKSRLCLVHLGNDLVGQGLAIDMHSIAIRYTIRRTTSYLHSGQRISCFIPLSLQSRNHPLCRIIVVQRGAQLLSSLGQLLLELE